MITFPSIPTTLGRVHFTSEQGAVRGLALKNYLALILELQQSNLIHDEVEDAKSFLEAIASLRTESTLPSATGLA